MDLSSKSPLSPTAKVALTFEVVVSLVRARRTLRRAGLPTTVAELRSVQPNRTKSADDSLASGRRLARVVWRTLAVLPGDTRCLSQSLVLTRLLARRGIDSQLVIGVRPGEKFAAHAWVEHAGVPLLPPGASDFRELVTF